MFAGFSLVAGALVVALRGPLPVALLLFGLAALSALRRGRLALSAGRAGCW